MDVLTEVRDELSHAMRENNWVRVRNARDRLDKLRYEKPSGKHFAREPWEVIYPRWMSQEEIAKEYGLPKEGQPW